MVRTHASAVAIVACAAVSACGAATSPLAPAVAPAATTTSVPSLPAALPGVWHGYTKAIQCIIPFPCHPEATVPFVLRVASSGGGFIGALEMESPFSTVMNVTGAVQADGSVLFTGAQLSYGSVSATMELRRLSIRLDAVAGLTGDIDLFRHAGPNDYNHTFIGRVLSASYQPFVSLPGQSVSGRWTGVGVVRSCAGYCRPSDIGDSIELIMVVGQSGGAVTGTLQVSDRICYSCAVPVTGAHSGAIVALSSVRTALAYGRVLTLEQFDGSLDMLGRIGGRFTYTADGTIAISPFNVSRRIECDILWLKRD